MTPLGSTRLMNPRSWGVIRSSEVRRDSTDCQISRVESGASDILVHSYSQVYPRVGSFTDRAEVPLRPRKLAGFHLSCPQGVVTNPSSKHVDNACLARQS